jgi:hypothetical protein
MTAPPLTDAQTITELRKLGNDSAKRIDELEDTLRRLARAMEGVPKCSCVDNESCDVCEMRFLLEPWKKSDE